jgi:small-conductance mechanosensitive channel
MQEILNRTLWGNIILSYSIALIGIGVIWVVLKLIKKRLIVFLKTVSARSKTKLDDVIIEVAEKFVIPYLYLLISYTIITQLNLSEKVQKILSAALAVVTAYYLVRLINFTFHRVVLLYMKRRNEPENRIKQVDGMLMVMKAIIWIAGIIMLADNLGYDVTTIIAGLGVGGIAIALAAQSILGDLFSYIVIFFDKPFEIGDFIIIDDHSGIVERIGIKTSHVRSLDGQQLIMPNAEMTKSVIQNYKRLQRRRVVFNIGVVYYTSSHKLRSIPATIKDIVSVQDEVDFDRVHLKSFGDFSINYEIVYYVNSADYLLYMDIHQEICMNIFEEFEKSGIEFAFPTQTLFVNKQDEGKKEEKQTLLHQQARN